MKFFVFIILFFISTAYVKAFDLETALSKNSTLPFTDDIDDQLKKFNDLLNAIEQIQKNADDIADLGTNDDAKLSPLACNYIKNVGKVAEITNTNVKDLLNLIPGTPLVVVQQSLKTVLLPGLHATLNALYKTGKFFVFKNWFVHKIHPKYRLE